MDDATARILSRLHQDALIAGEPTPKRPPIYRYHASEGDRIVLRDGAQNEVVARSLTGGAFLPDEPVIYGAGMAIGRGAAKVPGRRRGLIQTPVLTGEWVYSNLQGVASVTQNDFTNFVWSYNTRPNSSLFEFSVFNGTDDDEYWMRSVDFLFARVLTVTTPLRLTVELTVDFLDTPLSGSFTEFSQVVPLCDVLISTLGAPITLASTDDVLNAIYAVFPEYTIGYRPEVPPESSNPWNRSQLMPTLLNSPMLGIVTNDANLFLSPFEGTDTQSYDITIPGTYLITGRLGATFQQLYLAGPGGSATAPANPNDVAVLWAQYDANITIAPPP